MKKNFELKIRHFFVAAGLLLVSAVAQAQEHTNAFDDLSRQGMVNESQSVMRIKASQEEVNRLVKENPKQGYFCFTENRKNDIRSKLFLPKSWIERKKEQRTIFTDNLNAGEFFTFQIGVFAPTVNLENVKITFSDLKNEKGDKIKAASFTCFNLGGIDKNGKSFTKVVSVSKGELQAFWIGLDTPTSAVGTYIGTLSVKPANKEATTIAIELVVDAKTMVNHGENEGWRKSRLRWLNYEGGTAKTPTKPYIPVTVSAQTIKYLGGEIQLSSIGLPKNITTHYNQSNQLDKSISNSILSDEIRLVIETKTDAEILKPQTTKIVESDQTHARWQTISKSKNFELTCTGDFQFDGFCDFTIQLKSLNNTDIKDIRLEVPYTEKSSSYMMGLGRSGGFRTHENFNWKWDTTKNQDKIWIGAVNAGLNFRFKDEHFVRPLVNVYYALGKLNLPTSWGNNGKGGINVTENSNKALLTAYSGERMLSKGQQLYYNFEMLITPVKPLNLYAEATERIYHSNSDLSNKYLVEAKEAGANYITIHHKKDVYPYINYPYHDASVGDMAKFIQKAHQENIKVRAYYTTRELTIHTPEIWALKSFGSEVIFDGPGKDSRTLIHPNGPDKWLVNNFDGNYIPAWYNAFNEGPYKGEMDISVITTPDSRWNNYFLGGLDWMVNNIGLDGFYIDDSALDRNTMQRARRILDADGQRRIIDMHSWNHNNPYAGFANSIQLYMDLLPYVDRTWLGESFGDEHSSDFWLVEMSGIPFGMMSEMLDARNQYRGMVFGMLPRIPWSGNPKPLWRLWDGFVMKEAQMYGYWDTNCPVKSDNPNTPVTVYVNKNTGKALVAIANWSDTAQKSHFTLNESVLGFKPTKVSAPEIENLQAGSKEIDLKNIGDIKGKSGLILLMEQ